MKIKQDKYHPLISGYKHENIWAQIGDKIIWESNKEKLLGLQIDRNRNFNEHVSSLYNYHTHEKKVGNTSEFLVGIY